jgi:hypothetical protein
MEAPMLTALRIRGYLIGWLLFALFVPWLSAEPRQQGNDKNILARFSFRPGEPSIMLPVQVAGKTYTCLLDTGSAVGIYDPSLPLGKVAETLEVESANGPITLSKHAPPKALLGDMALHEHGVGFVLAYDFTKVRQVAGEPLFGVIGMDFLYRRVVQVDFDAGEVRFLREASANCGQECALKIEGPWRAPLVKIKIADVGEPWFLIDSGLCSLDSGGLEKNLFNALVEKKHLEVVGSTLSETAKGTHSSRVAQGKLLALGDFKVNNPIVDESRANVLSLNFLARFLVTFDFPNAKMYLKKGKAFDAPDLRDLSGLHLLRVDGKTIVHSVDPESQAAVRGIKAKDQLIKVANKPVEKMTLFQLRRLLATPAQQLECTLCRGEDLKEIVMQLK